MFATLTVGIAARQLGDEEQVRLEATPIKFVTPWLPNTASVETKVVGTVFDINGQRIPDARVRLRDLTSGVVFASGETNNAGNYEFTDVDPGTYVVEVVQQNDHVIALSDAGSLARFETLRTQVRLSGRWDRNTRALATSVNPLRFFGLGSMNSMTGSTLTMAAESAVKPVDPGEPVSPQ